MFGGTLMASKKDRRNSGYVTPNLTVSKKDLIKYDLFVYPFYDNWCDWRDGTRDWFRDFKQIKDISEKTSRGYIPQMWEKRIQMNHKQIKLLQRRKVREKNQKIIKFVFSFFHPYNL